MARRYLGRSGRDSAGDTIDPQWYVENGVIIRSHWGSETVMRASDAIAELEDEAFAAEETARAIPSAADDCLTGARAARATIARIREVIA
jgi:hypothetical protein